MTNEQFIIYVLLYLLIGLIFASGVTDKGVEAELDKTFPKFIAKLFVAVFWPIMIILHWFYPIGGE